MKFVILAVFMHMCGSDFKDYLRIHLLLYARVGIDEAQLYGHQTIIQDLTPILRAHAAQVAAMSRCLHLISMHKYSL